MTSFWRVLVLAVLLVAVAVTVGQALTGAGEASNGPAPANHSPRYVDYLRSRTGGSAGQCDLPLNQRVGGWYCYDSSAPGSARHHAVR